MTKTVLLGNVAEINANQVGKGYPYEKIKYIDVASVSSGKVEKIDLDLANAPSRARRIVRDNDILISTVRPNLKHFAYIPEAEENLVASTGFATISGSQNVDPKYLYYYMTRDDITNYLTSVAEGQATTFPAFRPEILQNLKITLPELEQQKKIGNFLYSLDKKIELNQRMNETLEKIGQTLFKHYFIDNPDRNNWGKRSLNSFGEIICGKTPPKNRAEYFGGVIPFIKIPDMHGQVFITETQDNLTEPGRDSQRNKTLPANTICVSCIATVGLVSLTSQPSQTNQQINSVTPTEKEYTYYLYFMLKSIKSQLIDMASGGSATPNLNTSSFSKISITTPDNKILRKFDQTVRIIFERILNNQNQNKQLAELRDSLLPRLISGKIHA